MTLESPTHESAGPKPGSAPVVLLVGPTAIGKSRLALRLAKLFRADIISADSRQVYRYMDIGTAKPSPTEQEHVRHYMLNLVAPDESYSAHRFAHEALAVLRKVGAEGRVALVVGGTGFYVRSLLDGPHAAPAPPHPAIRERLNSEVVALGSEALHRRLYELDPASAARIHAKNVPRLIRALEIIEQTGAPIPPLLHSRGIPALRLGLHMERSTLWRIADARVVEQVKAGLIEETRRLLQMGYSPHCAPLTGFAYRQAISYLQGRCTLNDAIQEYQHATHQYIRRQMTWFRSDVRITWMDASVDPFPEARERVAEYLATVAWGAHP